MLGPIRDFGTETRTFTWYRVSVSVQLESAENETSRGDSRNKVVYNALSLVVVVGAAATYFGGCDSLSAACRSRPSALVSALRASPHALRLRC